MDELTNACVEWADFNVKEDPGYRLEVEGKVLKIVDTISFEDNCRTTSGRPATTLHSERGLRSPVMKITKIKDCDI